MCSMSISFLYVASAFDMIKIGVTKNLDLRMRALNHARLHHSAEVPDEQAAAIEAYTHGLLQKSLRGGEWFSCSADDAIRAVDEAVERHVAGLPMPEPSGWRRARQNRGILLASQRRAEQTTEKLKIAIPLWFGDLDVTVKEISRRCGISTRTLYDRLPPRFLPDGHLPLRSEAREVQKKGKPHA